jgi:glycosyltransferase involved in cell wall biosynthesis
VEFVIIDDASTDGSVEELVAAAQSLMEEPRIDIHVESLEERSGVFGARNRGVETASAEILFITDAHVEFSRGWDEAILQHTRPNLILAGTTVQKSTSYRGYGCHLVVPFMGTAWNKDVPHAAAPVEIATSTATVITRDLFERLGGYDTGMLIYGAGEPEFSLRAWLHGAEIQLLPGLEVTHEFKTREQLGSFLGSIRHLWVHNCLRFGFLYLSELGCLQQLRFYSRAFPEVFPDALRMINESDVWERRALLEERRERSFSWFVEYFGIRDQIGSEIM